MIENDRAKINHSCRALLQSVVEEHYKKINACYVGSDENGFYLDIDAHEEVYVSSNDLPLLEQCMQSQSCVKEHGYYRLISLAGAYANNDSSKKMLAHIRGISFESEADLEDHFLKKEIGLHRDHRKFKKELQLFTFAPEAIGLGLPIWLPNGVIMREELENWAKQIESQNGYHHVVTPIIGRERLYQCSGHLDYYKEDMYAPISIDDDRYYLRPRNCPHHNHVYKAFPKSYRDLPYRIAEYGNVFRYEASGSLSGLMRSRGFCQNDAHIYCREDQIEEEFVKVLELFGRARVNFPFDRVEGEAAFYGPKIDVQVKSAAGQEYTISTNQLDFLSAKKFDLNYVSQDGKNNLVYVIHRAPLGSHERFIVAFTYPNKNCSCF